MAFNACNERLASERLLCPNLLLDNLARSVKFILDISIFRQSLFFLISGLNHLHTDVKVILRHGAKVHYYLIFSQESYASFDSWLENSLADHSLGLTLKKSRVKIVTSYYDWAFIQNEDLFDAFIDCLYALSTRDLDYLTTLPFDTLITPPWSKLPMLEMPSNGVSVLSDPDGDSWETKFLPENDKKITSTASVDIPTRSKKSTLDYADDENELKGVPDFSYIFEASPNATAPDFSGIQQSTSPSLDNSKNLEAFRSSRLASIDSAGTNSGATKSFLESGGLIQPPCLGYFPLPQKGQSLNSFLTSSLSNAMPELDRENAHFNVSEALISAFERSKNLNFRFERLKVKEKTEKVKQIKRICDQEAMFESPYEYSARRRKYIITRHRTTAHTESESEFEYWRQQPRRPPIYIKKRRRNFQKKLGSDGRSESFKSTTEHTTSPSSLSSEEDEMISSFSAENVALSLIRNSKIKNVQLSDASELKWLVSENEAPQTLLPLPKTWNSASESESDFSCGALDKSMRLRGTFDWAPPRPQLIFHIHPPPNLHNILEIQKYRCAGCGMKVESRYATTFRYCNYLGRYFCTGCHTLKKARLPQMIIHKWDFSPYLVSNFSATLLESLQSDPVYNVLAINPNLMKKVRLNNFRNYRIQLGYLAHYVRNCKAAATLCEELEKFPTYYTADVDLYSIQDIVELRFSIGLPLKTKEFVTKGVFHVLHCELCKQLGFVCEVCKKDEIIFPFQVNMVRRCYKCSSCFHIKCFSPGIHCPKCARLRVRSNQNTDTGVALA